MSWPARDPQAHARAREHRGRKAQAKRLTNTIKRHTMTTATAAAKEVFLANGRACDENVARQLQPTADVYDDDDGDDDDVDDGECTESVLDIVRA